MACSCHEGKLERTEWVIYQSFNLTTAIAEVHMSKRLDSAHLCLEVNVYTRRLGCFLTRISQTLPESLLELIRWEHLRLRPERQGATMLL